MSSEGFDCFREKGDLQNYITEYYVLFFYIYFFHFGIGYLFCHKMCAWSALLGGFGGLEKGQNDDEL